MATTTTTANPKCRVRWNRAMDEDKIQEGRTVNLCNELDKEFMHMNHSMAKIEQEEIDTLAQLTDVREQKRKIIHEEVELMAKKAKIEQEECDVLIKLENKREEKKSLMSRQQDVAKVIVDAIKRIRTIQTSVTNEEPPPRHEVIPASPKKTSLLKLELHPPPPPPSPPPPSVMERHQATVSIAEVLAKDVCPPPPQVKGSVRLITPNLDTTRLPFATRSSPVVQVNTSHEDFLRKLKEVNTGGYTISMNNDNGMSDVTLKTDEAKKILLELYQSKRAADWHSLRFELKSNEDIVFEASMYVRTPYGNLKTPRCTICRETIETNQARAFPWGEAVCTSHQYHVGCGILAKNMLRYGSDDSCVGRKIVACSCAKKKGK